MEWILSHMDDADLNDPIPELSTAAAGSGARDASTADPEALMMLTSMGFTDRQVLFLSAAMKAPTNLKPIY